MGTVKRDYIEEKREQCFIQRDRTAYQVERQKIIRKIQVNDTASNITIIKKIK